MVCGGVGAFQLSWRETVHWRPGCKLCFVMRDLCKLLYIYYGVLKMREGIATAMIIIIIIIIIIMITII